jgi:hypothetical protein
MHTVSLTSLSPLKEIPAAANLSSRPEAPQVSKDVGAVPADPITNFRPLFLFPLQQTIPALDQLHPRPCYPVTEVYKWQQQPKLKQRQPQRIPSNAG